MGKVCECDGVFWGGVMGDECVVGGRSVEGMAVVGLSVRAWESAASCLEGDSGLEWSIEVDCVRGED